MQSVEKKFQFSATGEVTAIVDAPNYFSQGLIEQTALAANQAMGERFRQRGLPTIYRVHPEKDAEELGEWLDANKASLPKEAQEICSKMMARKKMQDKYIGQCFDLYGDDFNVTLMPLLDHEVRGVDKLKDFSENLIDPIDLEAS